MGSPWTTPSTFTGGTTINAGTLQVGVSSVTSGSGSTLSITSGATGVGLVTPAGGTLDVSAFNVAVAGLSGSSGTIASSSTTTAGSLTIVTNSTAPQAYSGLIADSTGGGSQKVSVTVAGNGAPGSTQTLAGANTYSGGTTIASGALQIGASSVTSGSGSTFVITSGATGVGP